MLTRQRNASPLAGTRITNRATAEGSLLQLADWGKPLELKVQNPLPIFAVFHWEIARVESDGSDQFEVLVGALVIPGKTE